MIYKVGDIIDTFAISDSLFCEPSYRENDVVNHIKARVIASEMRVCKNEKYIPIQTAIRDIFKVMRNPNKAIGTVLVANTDMTYHKRLTDMHAVPFLNAFEANGDDKCLTLYVDASMFDDMAHVHAIVDEERYHG